MSVKEILLLGNDRLYEISKEVLENQIDLANRITEDLHDTLMEFRGIHGFGRAIAAPQIGQPYRILYMNCNNNCMAFINPKLDIMVEETYELWDDCMSFPGLEVKLKRYKKVRVYYKDLEWNDCVIEFEGDLAELIQHEYDHLDGILAVQRAVDDKSFRINKNKVGSF